MQKKAEVKAPVVKATEVKEAEKKTEEKPPIVKALESRVAEVKAEAKEVEKQEVKKEAPKKTEKKATPKKVEKALVVPEVTLQFEGQEADVVGIAGKIKALYVAEGHRESSIKSLQVYLKPEENVAYYVINKKATGHIDLF